MNRKQRQFSPQWLSSMVLLAFVATVITPGLSAAERQSVRQSEGSLRLVPALGHGNTIVAVAFSPCGRFVATAGHDSTARLWEFASGAEVHTLVHEGFVTSLSFSPDGRYLATGSNDNTARLWDVAEGSEVWRVVAHEVNSILGGVTSVEFSHSGQSLATGGDDGTVALWDVASRAEVWRSSYLGHVSSVALAPDDELLAAATFEGLKLWTVTDDGGRNKRGRSAPREISALGPHENTLSVAFSADGRLVAAAGSSGMARVWEIATKREVRALIPRSPDTWFGVSDVRSVAFSPDGRRFATASRRTADLWNLTNGRNERSLIGHDDSVLSLSFSPDGEHLATGSKDTSARVWSVSTGLPIQQLSTKAFAVNSAVFAPDGRSIAVASAAGSVGLLELTQNLDDLRILRAHTGALRLGFSQAGDYLATAGEDFRARLWKVSTGKAVRDFDHDRPNVLSVAFSPDGQTLLTGSVGSTLGETAILWDVSSGERLHTFDGRSDQVSCVAFSPEGEYLATGGMDGSAQVWAASSRTVERDFEHTDVVAAIEFHPNGRLLATGSLDGTAKLWDLAGGDAVKSFDHPGGVSAISVSPDGQALATGGLDASVRVWDLSEGEMIHAFAGHTQGVSSVDFSPDGRYLLSASSDASTRLWDVSEGVEVVRLFFFTDGTLAAIDPAGRFDASNGGEVDGLHWVKDLEGIQLGQLKDRYYEPGLVARLLGFGQEPLRNVEGLDHISLHPAVDVLARPTEDDPRVRARLTNRGGGIGQVQVKVNGKEFAADARDASFVPTAPTLDIEINLSGASLAPGENTIEIIPSNAQGYLRGRGSRIVFQAPGEVAGEPRLFAIVVGVSDYPEDTLDLRFAAKDAIDMAKAFRLGANRLFGADRTDIQLLVTGDVSSEALQDVDVLAEPSRESLERAFERVRERATPADILVVYLAGHGVSVRTEEDLYAFPTSEAWTLELTDPEIRRRTAVTSEELTEWIKEIAALKQVMVLDTCAAGAIEERLTLARAVPSDHLRAIERLKDRTGFHVLMGSAADARSYEASRYGQGLLTYSLLNGMRGAALRSGEYVDVSRLFQHAADMVPRLAEGVGGIQKPRVAAPRGTSFDIGKLTREDRIEIVLAEPMSQILRPVLIDPSRGRDHLRLSAELRKKLEEMSWARSRGEEGLLFVDAEELPGAVLPSGTYSVDGDVVEVRLRLFRDEAEIGLIEEKGTSQALAGLADRLANQVARRLDKP